jgi:aromatic-L-amino-acid decarboxylase
MDPAQLPVGDMPPAEFRSNAHRLVDWIADYLEGIDAYPVFPDVSPGEIRAMVPAVPPEVGEPIEAILADLDRVVVPGVTHWNHPGFLGYFGITGSGPGIMGEMVSAALNVNAMLWRAAPAATELEEVAVDWLRQLLGLPEGFDGTINDTASSSSLYALAAAREALTALQIRDKGLAGRDLPRLRLYTTEEAHSSI